MTATITSTPFIICLAILGACVIAAVILDVSGYVPVAREILGRQRDEGRHAVKGRRSHARTGKAGPGGEAAERAADEFIAALQPESAPVPAAPVPEPLEALPPLSQRTRTAVITAPWEPPVSRGDLSSVRDALRAWNPAPAVPQEPRPEPEAGPGDDTGEIFLRLVGGDWSPAEMVARIEADVYGAAGSGGEEKAAFAGTSLPGLRDWDLTRPLSLPGGTVAGHEPEAGAA